MNKKKFDLVTSNKVSHAYLYQCLKYNKLDGSSHTNTHTGATSKYLGSEGRRMLTPSSQYCCPYPLDLPYLFFNTTSWNYFLYNCCGYILLSPPCNNIYWSLTKGTVVVALPLFLSSDIKIRLFIFKNILPRNIYCSLPTTSITSQWTFAHS